jgi:hypothetical protein
LLGTKTAAVVQERAPAGSRFPLGGYREERSL